MASMLRQLAQRSSQLIVKSRSAAAWETTAQLRQQYMYTAMDAMPARMAEARGEWKEVSEKMRKLDFSVNDLGVGVVRAVEVYCFYLVGRMIGSRSLTT